MNNNDLWKFNGILQQMQVDLVSDQYLHCSSYYKIYLTIWRF